MHIAPSHTTARLPAAIRCLTAFVLTLASAIAEAEISPPGDERAILAPLATQSLLLDGDAVGDHMVVVGERGHILVSRDAGASWTQAEVPTRATLTGVSLHDLNRGWAVGHDAIILRTRDGGSTWETVYAAPAEERPLLDVWFENADHGIAIGAYGNFLETRDGGISWKRRRVGDNDLHLNQIAAAPSGRLYIAAESGKVYRSDDNARSWIELGSPYNGSFFGTLPLDDGRVYVYGLRGRLFHSVDAGANWSRVDTRTQHMLTDGIALDGTGVLFTGMGGTLLIGEREGPAVVPFQRADRRGIAGALDAGDGAIVIFGEFGVERTTRKKLGPKQ